MVDKLYIDNHHDLITSCRETHHKLLWISPQLVVNFTTHQNTTACGVFCGVLTLAKFTTYLSLSDDVRDPIAATKEPEDEMLVKEAPPETRQEVLAAMQLLSHIAIECRNEQEFLQPLKSLSLISDTLRKRSS